MLEKQQEMHMCPNNNNTCTCVKSKVKSAYLCFRQMLCFSCFFRWRLWQRRIWSSLGGCYSSWLLTLLFKGLAFKHVESRTNMETTYTFNLKQEARWKHKSCRCTSIKYTTHNDKCFRREFVPDSLSTGFFLMNIKASHMQVKWEGTSNWKPSKTCMNHAWAPSRRASLFFLSHGHCPNAVLLCRCRCSGTLFALGCHIGVTDIFWWSIR